MEKTKKRILDRQRNRIHEVIFEADTPLGKAFDVGLLVTILASVIVVLLESVEPLRLKYGDFFFKLEWLFTIVFTIEYLFRIISVYRPSKYILSFWGIIDFLAILPTYLSLFLTGTQYFAVVRALRLLRVFRIFKLTKFLKESSVIVSALRASQAKLTVFLTFVILAVIIIGSMMYMVEGGMNEGFSSIPQSIYWAIVTLTTVGYGDIHPITGIGKFLAAIVMIMGYAVLAVPTGIVSAEIISETRKTPTSTQACRYCSKDNHEDDALYCKYCGEVLNE